MKKRTSTKRFAKSPAIQYLYDRYIGDDPVRVASVEEASANLEIAQKIYDLRAKAGLSQRALAKLVGTTASVICKLEDADYEGHSLSMLVVGQFGAGVEWDERFCDSLCP